MGKPSACVAYANMMVSRVILSAHGCWVRMVSTVILSARGCWVRRSINTEVVTRFSYVHRQDTAGASLTPNEKKIDASHASLCERQVLLWRFPFASGHTRTNGPPPRTIKMPKSETVGVGRYAYEVAAYWPPTK